MYVYVCIMYVCGIIYYVYDQCDGVLPMEPSMGSTPSPVYQCALKCSMGSGVYGVGVTVCSVAQSNALLFVPETTNAEMAPYFLNTAKNTRKVCLT